ncbi:MAG TPA: TrkA family potassium uptake protein [Chloroflexota bacterium]|nr:TrkA family potassium uptake protein [Chloroflexota bacterium]
MLVLILGCGRVGARLANVLDGEGHDVRVIDGNVDSFQRLASDFKGTTIVGQGIDDDVLRKAGIEKADVFAAVTNDDNTNIMASQMAKVLHNVPKVITRIYDPIREETYQTLGLETVCPTALGAHLIEEMLDRYDSGNGAAKPTPAADRLPRDPR